MVHRSEWGQMAALRGNKIVSVPLADAIASNRKVDPELIEVANGILRAGRRDTILAVYPVGSANDYAHSLQLRPGW